MGETISRDSGRRHAMTTHYTAVIDGLKLTRQGLSLYLSPTIPPHILRGQG